MDPFVAKVLADFKAKRADTARLEEEARAAAAAAEASRAAESSMAPFVKQVLEFAGEDLALMSDEGPAPANRPRHITNMHSVEMFLRNPKTGERKMLLRVPRETSKRFAIGTAALKILRARGPLTTKDIYDAIDQTLLEPSTQPLSYLSNALSKDARFMASSEGWVPNSDYVDPKEPMFE